MDRTVRTVLTADVSGHIRGMKQAADATEAAVGKMGKAAAVNSAEWDRAGTAALAAGALLAGGAVLAVKAASDWESAFAGVKKTVEGTPAQIGALEDGLRGLARTMATSHTEIAAVAEAAGQLGVQTPDVVAFTRTMVMLGETTNLTADAAATSIAQFSNVMQTAPELVGRLGATLVALGNDGASTEAQIMDMGQRIAGAGRAIGASEAQVLGYASAIASVGINAEAGGTAMSKVFLKLEGVVREGGTNLQTLSAIAGVDFRQAFAEDAPTATRLFIEGLERMRAAGGDVTATLDQLGIEGQYETNVLRSLAGAGDLLARSMATADGAMRSGSALVAEYAQRAATTESQVKVAWNNIKDAAIDAGGALLPVVADMAQGIAGLAQAYGAMSPQAQGTLTTTLAVAGGLLLVVGGTMKAVSAVSGFVTNLQALGVKADFTGEKVSGMAGKVGRFTTKLLAGALAARLIGTALSSLAKPAGLDEIAESIDGISKSGVELETLDRQMRGALGGVLFLGPAVTDVGTAFRWMGDEARTGTTGFNRFMDSTVGALIGVKSAGGRVTEEFGKMDQALTGMARGGRLNDAQAAFRKLSDAAVQQGESIEFAATQFPQFLGSLQGVAEQLDVAGLSASDYARWMRGDIPAAVQAAVAAGGPLVGTLSKEQAALAGAADAARGAVVALEEYAGQALEMSGTEIGFKAAIADAIAGLKDHKKGLDLNTAAGRENQTQLNGAAAAATDWLKSMSDAGAGQATLEAKAKTLRAEIAATAEKLGMSKTAAAEFAAAMVSIPGEVAPTFSAPGATVSAEQARDMASAVRSVPGLASARILAPGARPSKAEVDDFVESIGEVPGLTKAQIRTLANLAGVQAVKDALAGVHNKTVTITTFMRKHRIEADGGFYPASGSGLQAFADGGMAGWPSSLVRGTEDHRPQIVQPGAWRLFGEPETMGESFIPHAPSKREASIPIWIQTGKILGMIPNADGNIFGVGERPPGGSVAWPEPARAGTAVNVTTYYPQAEPSSVTSQRALQYAAALGL